MRNRRFQFGVLLLGACVSMHAGQQPARAEDVDLEKATKVRAAYLLNFCKFVTWPGSVFPDQRSPIVIGVMSADSFADVLEATVRGKTVGDRPIEVRRFTPHGQADSTSLKSCHMLYFGKGTEEVDSSTIHSLDHASVLLVGEGERFASVGGMIGFVTDAGRVLFWASKSAATAAKLELSSQILKLAQPMPQKAEESASDKRE